MTSAKFFYDMAPAFDCIGSIAGDNSSLDPRTLKVHQVAPKYRTLNPTRPRTIQSELCRLLVVREGDTDSLATSPTDTERRPFNAVSFGNNQLIAYTDGYLIAPPTLEVFAVVEVKAMIIRNRKQHPEALWQEAAEMVAWIMSDVNSRQCTLGQRIIVSQASTSALCFRFAGVYHDP
ncbi:uncharacterized protein N7515_002582 [Penicillium bovifimosum]|uniref:Uncharacterized protein n=1 Tax=Penicillium bovifimosum TaxID=126998 RepID=A0A9W9HBT4_9EURO|nr:uncharacterized protein N7515_002582 [Penicillium bovifimosum]KAJ5143795.1 hypothetical protein N7515_002582 [Penicillium bovifimosum]